MCLNYTCVCLLFPEKPSIITFEYDLNEAHASQRRLRYTPLTGVLQ